MELSSLMIRCWTSLLLASCAPLVVGADEEPLDWWQTTVIYQVYPRSFQDSDGDGIGDIKGIIQRLDYFKETGIGTIWINPIYQSPNVDFGYDISNYTEIDPLFGSMDDFVELKTKCHELGLKLILDLVPNHTSNESEWFKNSLQKIEPYTDYYVWEDPVYAENGTRMPPNNWISLFYGSSWEWRDERKQYYLHQFAYEQPDLNFRNPLVVQELQNVMRYWLDQGLDGFRMDAVPFLFEDKQLRNEYLVGDLNARPNSDEYPVRYYTQNLPETVDMVQQWRELLDEYSATDNITRVMVTEVYARLNNTFQYYGTKERPGAHFTFNFFMISELNETSKAVDFNHSINVWLQNIPKGFWSNWVIGNHDVNRAGSRFEGLTDGLNALTLWLPGTAITYYGDEIGMVDANISYEDTIDPLGRAAGPDHYLALSRDPARTPFQWDNSTNAGFSTSNDTWLPVNPNYKELNLQKQKEDSQSHYRVYRRLVAERKARTLQRGTTKTDVLGEDVLAFVRELTGDDTYCVSINMGNSSKTVDLRKSFPNIPSRMTVIVSSVGSTYSEGSMLRASKLALKPKEFVGLKGTPMRSPARCRRSKRQHVHHYYRHFEETVIDFQQ